VVDVPVVVEEDLVAVQRATSQVREASDREQVGALDEGEAIVERQALAGEHGLDQGQERVVLDEAADGVDLSIGRGRRCIRHAGPLGLKNLLGS
jgi:hypothetical protein